MPRFMLRSLLTLFLAVWAVPAQAGLHDEIELAIREADLPSAMIGVSIRDAATGVQLLVTARPPRVDALP